jgi:hypothetical protein
LKPRRNAKNPLEIAENPQNPLPETFFRNFLDAREIAIYLYPIGKLG